MWVQRTSTATAQAATRIHTKTPMNDTRYENVYPTVVPHDARRAGWVGLEQRAVREGIMAFRRADHSIDR